MRIQSSVRRSIKLRTKLDWCRLKTSITLHLRVSKVPSSALTTALTPIVGDTPNSEAISGFQGTTTPLAEPSLPALGKHKNPASKFCVACLPVDQAVRIFQRETKLYEQSGHAITRQIPHCGNHGRSEMSKKGAELVKLAGVGHTTRTIVTSMNATFTCSSCTNKRQLNPSDQAQIGSTARSTAIQADSQTITLNRPPRKRTLLRSRSKML